MLFISIGMGGVSGIISGFVCKAADKREGENFTDEREWALHDQRSSPYKTKTELRHVVIVAPIRTASLDYAQREQNVESKPIRKLTNYL